MCAPLVFPMREKSILTVNENVAVAWGILAYIRRWQRNVKHGHYDSATVCVYASHVNVLIPNTQQPIRWMRRRCRVFTRPYVNTERHQETLRGLNAQCSGCLRKFAISHQLTSIYRFIIPVLGMPCTLRLRMDSDFQCHYLRHSAVHTFFFFASVAKIPKWRLREHRPHERNIKENERVSIMLYIFISSVRDYISATYANEFAVILSYRTHLTQVEYVTKYKNHSLSGWGRI